MDIHQFFLGNSFDAHTYFGAHVTEEGVVFRTLAPNAAAVDLIWEGGEWEPMPMKKVHDGSVYELTVPEAVPGQMYKYRITPQNPDGDVIDHCDCSCFETKIVVLINMIIKYKYKYCINIFR